MVKNGFYVLKDSFFEVMNDPYLKNNKDGNRPFYYCIKDDASDKDIYWMIPLSSRIDKYAAIIQKKLDAHKPCDGLYICKLPSGKTSAFLIQDLFPITEEYVEREYTLAGAHLVLPYEADIAEIEKKSIKVRAIIKRGIKLTPTSPDVISILSKL